MVLVWRFIGVSQHPNGHRLIALKAVHLIEPHHSVMLLHMEVCQHQKSCVIDADLRWR